MEGETQVSSEIPVVKAVEDIKNDVDTIEVKNEEVPQLKPESKKEEDQAEDQAALGEEFIKVEKEAIDVKDVTHKTEAALEDTKPSDVGHSSHSSREVLEAQEKVKELEIELERASHSMKQYESENIQLKDEISVTNNKLKETGKLFDELEVSHKKLQEQFAKSEEKYNLQLKALEDALQDQDAKHKELYELKESFDSLTVEVESSRKQMKEMELEIESSTSEAKKFEELLKQSGSHAESETQKALEFERLLQDAKFSARETEDRMASLQQELKDLNEKISENEKNEAALKTTTAELSMAQEELARSNSQVLGLEQRLSKKEALIDELAQELEVRKVSESQVKEDISNLENLVASTKESLQEKLSELEEIKSKLEEEMNVKNSIETGLKSREEQLLVVQEELAKVIQEKGTLETTVTDLTANAAQLKELYIDVEEKFKHSDENFHKADSLLSQALSNNAELEQKVKSLEELHNESGGKLATATQRSLEFEEIVQASNAAAEEANLQLRELETRFLAVEQRNVELEQLLNLQELKGSDAQRGLEEFSEKVSELNASLEEAKNEKLQLIGQVQEFRDKIELLEPSLSQASSKNSELEENLKTALAKCAEHEERANIHHSRSIELEDLIQNSRSKTEDFGKKVNDLELLLETEKYRIQELEEQIRSLDQKCADAEADSKKYSDKVSDLASELQAYITLASTLESALETSTAREVELTETLNIAIDEKKKLEDLSKSSSDKLAEVENLLEVLREELKLAQQNLDSTENDLKATGMRESEILEKLKSAEEQLEQQRRVIEQTKARSLELESQHESMKKDSEVKVKEVIANFTNRDTEAKCLFEKVNILEDQVKSYEEQLAEMAKVSASLKEELEESLVNLATSESRNEELMKQISEVDRKVSQSSSENELLVETNNQLKSKIYDLEILLHSAISDKEATSEQLAAHLHALADLKNQLQTTSELHSVTEARAVEAETKLQEEAQRYTHRNLESKELNEKVIELEGQVQSYKSQALQASTLADSQKFELEATHNKLKHLETIVVELETKSSHFEKESAQLGEANLMVTQKMADYESHIDGLKAKLSAALGENEDTSIQLQSLKNVIEDLTQQLTSGGQELQSQISSTLEESNLLKEKYHNTKREFESVISKLEEELKGHKSNEEALKCELDALKVEVSEKSALQTRLKEIEEELNLAQTTIAKKKELDLQRELEQDSTVKQSIEELEAKKREVELLQKQVKELEQKLQQHDAKSSVKADSTPGEMKDKVEITSRDIGSSLTSPSKRKSKKKLETSSNQMPLETQTQTQSSEASPALSFKFILGVALVSIIVGVILGKRY